MGKESPLAHGKSWEAGAPTPPRTSHALLQDLHAPTPPTRTLRPVAPVNVPPPRRLPNRVKARTLRSNLRKADGATPKNTRLAGTASLGRKTKQPRRQPARLQRQKRQSRPPHNISERPQILRMFMIFKSAKVALTPDRTSRLVLNQIQSNVQLGARPASLCGTESLMYDHPDVLCKDLT